MQRHFLIAAAMVFCLSAPVLAGGTPSGGKAGEIAVGPADWPWWRGTSRNGVAEPSQEPPLQWSETEGVLWKSGVPGRGHGSPAVCGDRVFLATAEEQAQVQWMLCFNRQNGKQLWKTEIHRGGMSLEGLKSNEKSSLASSSAACDGQRVFINFMNNGAIDTTALDLDGNTLWQVKVSDYVLHQGFGSSPAVYGPLVIVSADNKGGGAILGLDRATGDVVWKQDRPKLPNYASPILLPIGGRDQCVLIGCDLVTSFDPLTGKKLWETKGATTECVTSTVTDGSRVFTTGGYPKNHIAAVMADGSGAAAWEKGLRVYVPSLLARDGYLYAVLDAGVAMCLKSDTGDEAWTHRLGGSFSSSPVLVGDKVFATSEKGKTFVFKANPEKFELVAENHLGDEVMASPAICGGQIFLRVADTKNGVRSETLYCVGR